VVGFRKGREARELRENRRNKNQTQQQTEMKSGPRVNPSPRCLKASTPETNTRSQREMREISVNESRGLDLWITTA